LESYDDDGDEIIYDVDLPDEMLAMISGGSYLPYTLYEKDQAIIRYIPMNLFVLELKKLKGMKTVEL
jgi:hypothetical protein